MKGTVNGKSLDQVLSELKAPFPEEELKKNEKNETYIPVESLESRLNSVIGVLNYDTLVTYEGIQEVLGRFVVVAKTILIIYDDERNVLIRKSALGGSNIIVVKDTGKPSSLKPTSVPIFGAIQVALSPKNSMVSEQIGSMAITGLPDFFS